MKVSDAIAEILRREGIEWVIGYPVNHILERGAAAGIRPIIVRQERTGLHMADAVSRVTSGDQVGVFVMQYGPGHRERLWRRRAGLQRVGAAAGDAGRLPAPARLGRPQLQRQRLDAQHHQVGRAGDVRQGAAARSCGARSRGCARAAAARCWSRCRQTCGMRRPTSPTTCRRKPLRYGPEAAAVKQAANMLLAAKRPVLYAGQGVHWAKAWDELKRARGAAGDPGLHQPRRQERISRDASAGARLRRPRDAGDGAALPARGRSDLRHRLQLHADEFRRDDAEGQDDHPRHARSDRRQQGRRLRARRARRRQAHACGDHRGGASASTARAPRDPSAVAREIKEVDEPWLAKWMPKLTHDGAPLSPVSRAVGPAAHRRHAEHDHHPRRRLPARPALAVLALHGAALLSRLGQEHAARLWPRASRWAPSSPSPTSSA